MSISSVQSVTHERFPRARTGTGVEHAGSGFLFCLTRGLLTQNSRYKISGLCCGVSPNKCPFKQTEAVTGLSEKAVRHHFSLFRSQLPQDSMLLSHLVQVDEAYFGGMLGFALLMGKQKGTRKLAYQILPHNAPSKQEAITFIQTFVHPTSLLATDGSILYKDIQKYYPVTHTVDIHKKFEFTHTSEIEGMFGVLRTFIRRMYHHVTVKHFPEIMCEFYYRFCHPEIFISPYEYLLNTLRFATTG